MEQQMYKEQVAEGKALVKAIRDAHWALGDLALRVAPKYNGRDTADTGATLIRWAKDIGWDAATSTVMAHRATAWAWPKKNRVAGASYDAHVQLRLHKDRFKLLKSGMTADRAAVLAGKQPKHKKYDQLDPVVNLHSAARYLKAAVEKLETLTLTEAQLELLGIAYSENDRRLEQIAELLGFSEPIELKRAA